MTCIVLQAKEGQNEQQGQQERDNGQGQTTRARRPNNGHDNDTQYATRYHEATTPGTIPDLHVDLVDARTAAAQCLGQGAFVVVGIQNLALADHAKVARRYHGSIVVRIALGVLPYQGGQVRHGNLPVDLQAHGLLA